MRLRYGTNPHLQMATAEPVVPGTEPVRVLAGEPSYLNLLDGLSGWGLVRELAASTGRTAAASIKHLSPAGAALDVPADPVAAESFGFAPPVGPAARAYLRARDTDPRSSYGDVVAVSAPVDAELAELLRKLVVDAVIAPEYEPGAVARLAAKRGGRFLVLRADPDFRPPPSYSRQIAGLSLTEPTDDGELTGLVPDTLPPAMATDLLVGLIVVRHTQSNSIAYVRDGATLGVGAGQQSRIDCTRLAGARADTWWLRRHPAVRAVRGGTRTDRINAQVRFARGELDPAELRAHGLTEADAGFDRRDWAGRLDGVALASDGALPFADNVTEAARHGVRYLAEPGGSRQSAAVSAACDRHGITRVVTGRRLFRH